MSVSLYLVLVCVLVDVANGAGVTIKVLWDQSVTADAALVCFRASMFSRTTSSDC